VTMCISGTNSESNIRLHGSSYNSINVRLIGKCYSAAAVVQQNHSISILVALRAGLHTFICQICRNTAEQIKTKTDTDST